MDNLLSGGHRYFILFLLTALIFTALFVFLKPVLNILILMYLAIVLAEGLRPFVYGLCKLGLPKSLSASLVLFILLICLLFLVWLLISPLIDELQNILNQLPEFNAKAQSYLTGDQIFRDNQLFISLKEGLGDISKTLSAQIITIPRYILNLIFNTVVVFFLAFFWLSGSERFEGFFLNWFPQKDHQTIILVIKEIGLNFGSYIRGVLIMMLFIGLISGVGVWLLGLPYALVLGIIAGLTEAVPIIGPFIGATPAVIIALFISPQTALFVALFYLVLQQIEGNVLVPLVMNRILELEPLIILLSVLLGVSLLGITGAFLAIPTASITQTILKHIVFPRLKTHYSSGS